MARQDKFITISLAASISNVLLNTLLPKSARITMITARQQVNSNVTIHIGNGTNSILLEAGQTASVDKDQLSSPKGQPITWGAGVDDSLYVTTGSALQDGTVTAIIDEY